MESILVPFDFSAAAEDALAWAAKLVRACGGSIILVHVVPLLPLAAIPMTAPAPSPEDRAILAQQLCDAAARHDVDASVDLIRSVQIGPAIVECARDRGADLIVMGTHGRSGLKRAVLGSAADYVVRCAPCPVVTVRERT